MFNPDFVATTLEDYLDQFFPDCTLCNDTDFWEDGTRCICNGDDYWPEELIFTGKYITIYWSED